MNSSLLLTIAFALFAGCHCQLINMILEDVATMADVVARVPCDFTTELTGKPQYRWYRKLPGSDTSDRIYTYQEGNEPFTGQDSGFNERSLEVDAGVLIIRNVTLEDNDILPTLICQVDFGAAGSNQSSLNFLVYQEASAAPTATLESTNPFQSNNLDPQQIGSCVSGFGYPKPQIIFYRGSVMIVSQDEAAATSLHPNQFANFITTGSEMLSTPASNDPFSIFQDTKTYNTQPGNPKAESVKDNLYRVITKDDDKQPFFCVVKSGNPASPLVQNVSFPAFRVSYSTDEVIVDIPKTTLYDGNTITAECKPNGYPDATITDFEGQTSSTYEFVLSKSTNTIRCIANNGGDDVVGEKSFKVIYLDRAEIIGNSKAMINGQLTLTCEGMSNGQGVTYTWKKDGKKVGSKAKYMKGNMQFSDQGTYTCTAKVGPLMKEASVDVTVNGIVVSSDSGKMEKKDKNAILSCTAEASPKPTFVWMRDGSDNPLASDNNTSKGNMHTSYLTVGPLDSTFSNAKYTCKITSGNAAPKEVTVTLDEIKEASSPVAGIIIGILVAVLIIAIILAVLYNKGIICKSSEKGDENAEDIAVDIHKDGAGGDVETGKPAEPSAEEEKLMNGN